MNPIKLEYKPVQNTSDIIYFKKIYISYSMYHLTPANYCDLKTVLLNKLPNLSDSEIEILIEIFLSM